VGAVVEGSVVGSTLGVGPVGIGVVVVPGSVEEPDGVTGLTGSGGGLTVPGLVEVGFTPGPGGSSVGTPGVGTLAVGTGCEELGTVTGMVSSPGGSAEQATRDAPATSHAPKEVKRTRRAGRKSD